MWKSALKIASPLIQQPLLNAENLLHQQLRTTFILKRRTAPNLKKKGFPAKSLRSRHYIYELVKDTEIEKQQEIEVILTSFVDGLGNVGDKVSVKPIYAYTNLLLPGLALYATPANVQKYENVSVNESVVKYSSPFALKTINQLSQLTLSVLMNKDNPWTLQPWHIKASFRKCGYIVPEEAIELPPQPIKGPILDKDQAEFYVTVTINKQEKVIVRCRLRHWSTSIMERLPYVEEFWKKTSEPIHPEFAEVLEQIPKSNVNV